MLGISHPRDRNWGSAPGASCVSSSLLERDEGDPLREARSPGEVITAGKGRGWFDVNAFAPFEFHCVCCSKICLLICPE